MCLQSPSDSSFGLEFRIGGTCDCTVLNLRSDCGVCAALIVRYPSLSICSRKAQLLYQHHLFCRWDRVGFSTAIPSKGWWSKGCLFSLIHLPTVLPSYRLTVLLNRSRKALPAAGSQNPFEDNLQAHSNAS